MIRDYETRDKKPKKVRVDLSQRIRCRHCKAVDLKNGYPAVRVFSKVGTSVVLDCLACGKRWAAKSIV